MIRCQKWPLEYPSVSLMVNYLSQRFIHPIWKHQLTDAKSVLAPKSNNKIREYHSIVLNLEKLIIKTEIELIHQIEFIVLSK